MRSVMHAFATHPFCSPLSYFFFLFFTNANDSFFFFNLFIVSRTISSYWSYLLV